jgi:cobalt-zinc-cadmium efflux system membrane fusion protein
MGTGRRMRVAGLGLLLVLGVGRALAHGGDDHGGDDHADEDHGDGDHDGGGVAGGAEPPLPQANVESAPQGGYEAVLASVDGGRPRLWIVRADTTSPVETGTVRAWWRSAEGSVVEGELQAEAGGAWRVAEPLPAGIWAGALAVREAEHVGLVGVDGVRVGAARTAVARRVEGVLAMPLETQLLVGLRTARAEAVRVAPVLEGVGHVVPAPGGAATLRAPSDGVFQPVGGRPQPGTRLRAGEVFARVRELVGPLERAELASRRTGAAVEREVALEDAARAARATGVVSGRERARRDAAAKTADASARAWRDASSGVPVRVPFGGTLAALLVQPGEVVRAGDALARVVGTAASWVRVHVPERDAAGILAGATAQVRRVAREDAPVLAAVVLDAGHEVDPANGRVPVTVACDAPLPPGAAARVAIASGEPDEGLAVPVDAVVPRHGVPTVLVKTGPEGFALREVRVGASDGARVRVLDGVSDGERVVVAGAHALRARLGG